jgi:hypothetical protein
MGTLEYLIDWSRGIDQGSQAERQRSALRGFAQSQFGADSPMVALAEDPDTFIKIAPVLLDPAKQEVDIKRKALQTYIQKMASGGQGAGVSTGATGGLSPEDFGLLAIINPDKAIDYTLKQNDPEQKAKAQAAIAEAQQPAKARRDVDMAIGEAKTYLDQLKKGGDIIDSENKDQGFLSRLGIQSANIPGIGPFFQNLISPQVQTEREKLKGIRSNLLTLYRQTAKIPGTVGDSAIEATSLANALPEGINYEADQERLKNFQRIYGSIGSQQTSPEVPPSPLSQLTKPKISAEAARAELARRRAGK